MKLVVVANRLFNLATDRAAARHALRAAGLASAPVLCVPYRSIPEARAANMAGAYEVHRLYR